MVVVRLSRTADRKNASTAVMMSSSRLSDRCLLFSAQILLFSAQILLFRAQSLGFGIQVSELLTV
jgi:hypothetical protein